MACIYEVNIVVNKDAYDEYIAWLHPHIDDILKIDGFTHAEIFHRKAEDEGIEADPSKVLLTVHYHAKDRASVDNYLKNFAAAFRADGQKHFGGRFTASRRILESFAKHQAHK